MSTTKTKPKLKRAAVDPFDSALEKFYAAHLASFEIESGYEGRRKMTRREISELWPQRSWWLAVQELVDEFFAIELPAWKLEPFAWLVRDVLLYRMDRARATEIGRRIDALKEARDNSEFIRHESVYEMFDAFNGMPGSEEAVMKFRGCTIDQAREILGIFDRFHQKNPAIDVAELEAELKKTCTWPQDKARVERESRDRNIFAELKDRWGRRPRFGRTEAEDSANDLDALFK